MKSIVLALVLACAVLPSSPAQAAACETEYKSGAQVCVKPVDARLDCQQNLSDDSYRGCDVEVDYRLESNYAGRSYLDVAAECEVEISYTGSEMLSWRSDSSTQRESHQLSAYGPASETMRFDFWFSSFSAVQRVKIASVRCAVRSVNLW